MESLTGKVFGLLTVLGPSEKPFAGSRLRKGAWLCRCVCDRDIVVQGNILRRGRKKSCGCSTVALKARPNFKHGMSDTRMYRCWQSMKTRCYSKSFDYYHCYGGRGIRVCPEWRDSFETFHEDMGLPPTSSHSIDRINNDGDYGPSNCRWATAKQQSRNRRNSRLIEFSGEVKHIAEWASGLGLTLHGLVQRLDVLGWTLEEALTTQKGAKRHG